MVTVCHGTGIHNNIDESSKLIRSKRMVCAFCNYFVKAFLNLAWVYCI